ncbi:ABC transporter substrate-binding protein [Derxia gummosa]|uniref:ABC transporter substrate-binding protein n=1 Tax=Derxia gummosa DSM 723 TaxID=1121388 RepID=A0A8B6X898_9BURK|nr:ABC transporter substrate-binding protein [Derxia gummosa]
MPLHRWSRRLALLLAASLLLLAGCSGNAPYPDDWIRSNTLFTTFNERPKYFDPISSYSTNETPWTYGVFEPLYQYHYLKRPYELIPRTALDLPEPRYYAKDGRELSGDPPASEVAESVYVIRIKPGVRYAPHPAFAKDEAGNYRYHALAESDLDGKYSPWDFQYTGTRELTADDYIYGIKRHASPWNGTPARFYPVIAQFVVGLRDLGNRLKAQQEAELKSGKAPQWHDLREAPFSGARALDPHTLELRIVGKYPQTKYWLAMTFFAPVPWEAERFYSQPGMAGHSLSLNTWPVGTGPFMIESQRPNQYVMVRNPNFHGMTYPCEGKPGDKEAGLLDDCGKPLPFVDRVVSTNEKESEPGQTRLLQGYADVLDIDRSDRGFVFQRQLIEKTGRWKLLVDHGVQLPSAFDPTVWYIGFNMLDPVVGNGRTPAEAERNRKLRQALSIATDWEEYASVFFDVYGDARAAMGPVPPGLFGYRDGEAGLNPVTHVWKHGHAERRPLDEAKKLLAEAGYPNGIDSKTGRPLVLYYDSNGAGPASQARFDWQIKQAARLGIQLEVRATDYNRYQDRIRQGQVQIFVRGWNADYPDPENFLFLLYGPNGKVKHEGDNDTNYENPEFDRLFEKMSTMTDGPEKQAIIDRMVKIVRDDAAWMWGLWPASAGNYQQWVHNGFPTIINRNTPLYLRIDPELRAKRIAEWNRPVLWPLAVLALIAALVAWPVWRAWQRRENATGRAPAIDLNARG